MNELFNKLREDKTNYLFSLSDLQTFKFDKSYLNNMLQELIDNNKVTQIMDNLYFINNALHTNIISEEILAQKLVPGSYVSMEYVLSQHSWIPESVFSVTSVTNGNSLNINSNYGYFEFVNIPQKQDFAGVKEYSDGFNIYYKASPLKALTDIICERDYNWTGLKPLYDSLRIEPEYMETLTKEDFDELHGTYYKKNAEDFLIGIRKELSL